MTYKSIKKVSEMLEHNNYGKVEFIQYTGADKGYEAMLTNDDASAHNQDVIDSGLGETRRAVTLSLVEPLEYMVWCNIENIEVADWRASA